MLKTLLPPLIKDSLLFLKQDKAFESAAMEKILKGLSKNDWVDELRLAFKALKGVVDQQQKPSRIIEAVAAFFLDELPQIFDQLDRDFYELSDIQQREKLLKLFPQNTNFFSALRSYLLVRSSQEVTEDVVLFLREYLASPRLIVQSPLECDLKTKHDIRAYLAKAYPKSFVSFSVNKQLIGGIRFFVDGKVDDLSWFSKIQALHTLSGQL